MSRCIVATAFVRYDFSNDADRLDIEGMVKTEFLANFNTCLTKQILLPDVSLTEFLNGFLKEHKCMTKLLDG